MLTSVRSSPTDREAQKHPADYGRNSGSDPLPVRLGDTPREVYSYFSVLTEVRILADFLWGSQVLTKGANLNRISGKEH